MSSLIYKIAETPDEFEQIFRLNYRTFTEEIPQNEPNLERRRVDKFHAENTYLICLEDGHLLGMLAMRDRRPFSLDDKLENLDSYLPPYTSICEIRLLAVEPDKRSTKIFGGLILFAARYCDEQAYDLAVMSGTTRQAGLYKHLGFTAFGPLVGGGDTFFQPMFITLDAYKKLKASLRVLNVLN
jgi:GNAT superfamily N-acetyltransferase